MTCDSGKPISFSCSTCGFEGGWEGGREGGGGAGAGLDCEGAGGLWRVSITMTRSLSAMLYAERVESPWVSSLPREQGFRG